MTEATGYSSNTSPKQDGFAQQIAEKEKLFALFFAPWCPFCREFLPTFEKYQMANPNPCMKIDVDDAPDLCERYDIQCYPTVILFAKGRIVRRLDSEPNVGLNANQFKTFVEPL